MHVTTGGRGSLGACALRQSKSHEYRIIVEGGGMGGGGEKYRKYIRKM